MLWLLLVVASWAVPTVAIADLENRTGDASLDAAGPGVAGILATRFAQTDSVRVVERDALVALLDEQRLTVAGLVDPATAVRAGRILGAEYLVVGELFSVKLPAISVNVRIVDTSTGEVVASREVVGEVGAKGERFFVLIDQLSDDILDAIDVTLGDSERAHLSSIERRELGAVLRYGEDLLRVNHDNPMSLYRESDRDFSRDRYWATHWVVYEHDGSELLMPEFARRVGDVETNAAYMDHLVALRRQSLRRNLVAFGYGLAGLAVGIGGSAVGNGDGNPETPTALQVTGYSFLALMPLHLIVNVAITGGKRHDAKYPGTYYTHEEADRWIHAYNLSLP